MATSDWAEPAGGLFYDRPLRQRIFGRPPESRWDQGRVAAPQAAAPPPAPIEPAENTLPQFDHRAQSSQPFRIDFAAMARKGFISQAFEQRRLARDMRAMRHRLLNRLDAFALESAHAEQDRKTVVLVTSCWPEEGKTFTALNLSLSMILEESNDVFLIDADITQSSIHRIFGFQPQRGLVDFLKSRDENLAPYLWRAENSRLTILPAGIATAAEREMFRGGVMSGFVRDVSSRFSDRIVIMDSPPMLSSGIAPVLANHADHIVLVIQAGSTSQSAVEDALDLLSRHDNVSLVLNRCNEGDRLTSSVNDGYGYRRE